MHLLLLPVIYVVGWAGGVFLAVKWRLEDLARAIRGGRRR